MSGNRSGQSRGGRVEQVTRGVFVARTISHHEKRLRVFTQELARYLGSSASIKTVDSMHVTYLSARGVTRELIKQQYSSGDIRGFAKGLRDCIKTAPGGAKPVAIVERGQPLIAIGRSRALLALHLRPDAAMQEQRAAIEDYLHSELGTIPDIVPFCPHITLGRMYGWALDELARSPRDLVPKKVRLPETVAKWYRLLYRQNSSRWSLVWL